MRNRRYRVAPLKAAAGAYYWRLAYLTALSKETNESFTSVIKSQQAIKILHYRLSSQEPK